MSKILGIDLGTNSIGLAVRDTDKGSSFVEQLDFFSSVIFKSGVGTGTSGEFSYAAERTSKRSVRRLYQSRKYRIWATLELLIENDCCPLSMEDLDKWRKYDKEKGLKRQYPVDAAEFEQWVRLDFDLDGKPEYTSPYALRAEIMQKQFDFTQQINRFKLGRILYHIAQRRGFKSSKGETLKELSEAEITGDLDFSTKLKDSENKKSETLVDFMEKNNIPTVGYAFHELEKKGIRIKESEYQAVRSQYKEEVQKIFEFQEGLDTNSEFFKRLTSEKKKEGTIFYKRPLRSQKGKVGTCTLEQGKPRCPISHPEFEEYRAWCFINNILYRTNPTTEWQRLPLDLKEQLFKEKFLRVKSYFTFKEIREWLSAKLNLVLSNDKGKETINYSDKTNVSACPVSARLKNLLGDDYKQWTFETNKERINHKTGEVHKVTYSYLDLWHICFSFDEQEFVEEFAKNTLGFDDKKAKQLCTIYNNIQQDYASLSLKAIRNINPFLKRGLIYTDAVLLAKLPEIFGDKWSEVENDVVEKLKTITANNRHQKEVYNIVNDLISDYKSLDYDQRFAEHNTDYILQEIDYTSIEDKLKRHFGEKTWNAKPNQEQEEIRKSVGELYQNFFRSSSRKYYEQPKLADSLANYLAKTYSYINTKALQKIYHPSMIEIYPIASKVVLDDCRYVRLLESPVIGALKNPMAMRILHTLRSQINKLIKEGKIDENTRIVVETAREVNDANMRWAIKEYQQKQEDENKAIEKIIGEYFPNDPVSDDRIRKAKILIDQANITDTDEQSKDDTSNKGINDTWTKVKTNKIAKYKLWLEQNCCCLYTGKTISISELFDENKFDIEHTVPRSISFDDSLSNLTICEARFNRSTKRNAIPSQLPNYDEIKPRLEMWEKKVKSLRERVSHWKEQSKKAQTKDRKDYCIRQKHLWNMELSYWEKKLNTFTITEVTDSFRNNQLNDTRIITKYAYHYLKTAFDHVSVQRGETTSAFRKIIGIQQRDEQKDRNNHSHHAIDAAVLTLVPSAKERNKMMKLFYLMKEYETNPSYRQELEKEKQTYFPNDVTAVKDYIEQNIFVTHIAKDQTLTPAKRRKRIRGKIDRKHEQWITGDCIRGRLHKDSFYGCIEIDGEQHFVIRRILKYKANKQDSGFSNWKELKEAIVDKGLYNRLIQPFCQEGSNEPSVDFKTAITEQGGLKDNGRKVRHIRCYTSVKKPLQIKEQTYKSKKDYKNYYYAEVGDLYTMCKYENKDTKEVEYKTYNLFQIAQNHKEYEEFIPQTITSKKKKTTLFFTQKLTQGQMVLLYKDSPLELFDMDNDQLSKRLYVIKRFESDGRITLVHHANAQRNGGVGMGEKIEDFTHLPLKIRQKRAKVNFLVEGEDAGFKISNGRIEFLNKSKHYD